MDRKLTKEVTAHVNNDEDFVGKWWVGVFGRVFEIQETTGPGTTRHVCKVSTMRKAYRMAIDHNVQLKGRAS